MNYQLICEAVGLIEEFAKNNRKDEKYPTDLKGFKRWIMEEFREELDQVESVRVKPNWIGKEKGRATESVINILIAHLSRFAKSYSKSALHDSDFATQEDFIYLITLKAFGSMTKMELIKENVQEKPAGMLVINRLIKQGWVIQTDSLEDKRSKIISISEKGSANLQAHMDKIRTATEIVTGNLNYHEKMELIRLLQKLDEFHQAIYDENLAPADLLDTVQEKYLIK